jgi:hypothetical protein
MIQRYCPEAATSKMGAEGLAVPEI